MPALPAPFRVGEPTFNVDYVNNTTLAAGPDGVPDSSGQHFINLASTLTARDNLRQAVANLIALTRAVPTLDLDGNPATDDIDETNIRFFGWSLGGIVGSAYAGTPGAAPIKSVALFAAGCGIMETLRQSPGYSPILNNGLAAAGSPPAAPSTRNSCTPRRRLVESGDGCNYAANWTAKPTLHADDPGHAGCCDQARRIAPCRTRPRCASRSCSGVPTITHARP